MSRTAQLTPQDRARPTWRSASTSTAAPPGRIDTGVGFFDHMLDLLARHGRLGLGVTVTRATSRPARTTRSRTPASCSARRSARRSATARGIRRYGHAVVPMDEARAACAIDISGRPYCTVDGPRAARRARSPGFEHEAAEEFFRAVASAGRLTLHLELQAGTNAHHMIEACFKAFARALRVAVVDRPRRDRRAVDQGDADVTVALVDYGMGNRRSVEKALEHVGARVARTADRGDDRRRRRDRAARRGRVPRGDAPAARARARSTLIRERADAGVPVLGICLGMQLLFESSDRARGRRGPRAARRHRDAAARRPG